MGQGPQARPRGKEVSLFPGFAQVDFGEADFNEDTDCVRRKYLTVSFPYSNDGYSQVFRGETAECVCQGLADIFNYIGGVPKLLVFDIGQTEGNPMSENRTIKKTYAAPKKSAV